MALVVKGRVVPMAHDRDEPSAFAGRVWIGDDRRVLAVTRGGRRAPAGFPDAPLVDVGDDLVLPGFVDMHNHLAYDTLPLWAEPTRTQPWPHHDAWPRAASYARQITWPAYALITAAPHELLAYVELKALVGGTTTIQGSPPKSRPRDGWLARNLEDETVGTGNTRLVQASTLTLDDVELGEKATRMRNNGAVFVYHCAEGRQGSIVDREFDAARRAGCLQDRFVLVHGGAVPPTSWPAWSAAPGAVAWSPFSNLWLYGETTDIGAVRATLPVRVCLGADWAPSGTKHVLAEAKVARAVATAGDWGLTDEDLVAMLTSNPGDMLGRAWPAAPGRLVPGALADIVVVAARRRADPFATVLAATERDVRLVVVDGVARYGEPGLMTAAQGGPPLPVPVEVAGQPRLVALTRPGDPTTSWPWPEVLAGLEAVRADPKSAIEAAQAQAAAWAGPVDAPDAPLRLGLDMPLGVGPTAGLPQDLGQVVVPPLESLAHDDDWFAGVTGRGFHAGVLDELAAAYS